jgi:hypothetical protein
VSVEAYNAVWKYFEGTQRQRVTMLALANRADEHGIAWSGIKELMRKTRMKRATIFEVLREIEKTGQLAILEGGGGRGKPSLRWLKLPGLDGDVSEAEQRMRKGPRARTRHENKGSEDPDRKGPNIRTDAKSKGSESSDQARKQRVRGSGQKGSEHSDSVSIGDTSRDTSTQTSARPRVNRKPVTDSEHSTATAIIEAFNQAARTTYTVGAHLTPIVGRIREHAGLSAEAHRAIIAATFRSPWWSGHPGPEVIYGSAAQFERCMQASNGDAPGGGGSKFARYDEVMEPAA